MCVVRSQGPEPQRGTPASSNSMFDETRGVLAGATQLPPEPDPLLLEPA
jgi:hypothetical protein